MGCKHENADHLMAGQFTMFEDGALWTADAECFRCVDCKAWLPLGDSDETDERVAIEIEAARLAAKWAPLDGEPYHVRDGWHWHRDGYFPEVPCDDRLVGYLARCISTHDAENGGEK